jgi:hypothetical protein
MSCNGSSGLNIRISSDQEALGLIPDYTKPYRDVFTDTAVTLLCSGNLEILSHSQTPKTDPEFPSWVPDWSSPIFNTLQNPKEDPGTGKAVYPRPDVEPLEEDYRSFSASSTLTAPVEFQYGPCGCPILSLSGIIFDTVAHTGWMWELDGVPFPSFFQLVDYIGQFEELSKKVESTLCPDRLKDAIWRTAITDKEHLSNESYCRVRQSYLQQPQDKIEEYAKPEIRDEIHEQGFDGNENIGVCHYLALMNTLAVGRRPFITSRGYIGQGPKSIQPGDIAVVFIGCRVPFIVNVDSRKEYRIAGEAYIHGIMAGEALQEEHSIVNIDLH